VAADANEIRAVLFDADGVVQRARPGWQDRLTAIGGPGFVEALFAAEHGPLVGAEPFADAVRTVLHNRGLDPDPLPVLRVWDDIELDKGAFDLVARVRAAGTPCHLASNQQDHRVRYMRDALGYGERFDELFFSSELGVAKPEAGFFSAIGERIGLPPVRILFIDDQPVNVEAARAVGLRAERHDPTAGANGLARLLALHGVIA